MTNLGPEGQKVLDHMSQQAVTSYTATSVEDSQIEYLIASLRNQNSIEPKLLLLNVAYYLPLAKLETHVSAIVDALLASPKYFAGGLQCSFEDAYMIIEAFNVIFEKKILISVPTVSLTSFYNSVLRGVLVYENAAWINWLKQNLLIAGIMLAKSTLDQYKTPEQAPFFKQFDQKVLNMFVRNFNNITTYQNSNTVKALNIVALACVFPVLTDNLKKKVNHKEVCTVGFDLLLKSPYGLANGHQLGASVDQKPVMKVFSKLSILIEKSVFELGILAVDDLFKALSHGLRSMVEFSATLHQLCDTSVSLSDLYWNQLKQILFATVIILQGYINLALSTTALKPAGFSMNLFSRRSSRSTQREFYRYMAVSALKILFHEHFIVDRIGVGGFQAYKLVYFIATETLVETAYTTDQLPIGEELSDFFIVNTRFNNLVTDTMARSKIAFLLSYWETLVLFCSPRYYDTVIMPLTSEFIGKPYKTVNFDAVGATRSLVEASHAVKLNSFLLERLAKTNTRYIIPYLDIVLKQYPQVLSSRQLLLATEAIAGHVHADGIIGKHDPHLQDMMLNKLFSKVLGTSAGHKVVDLFTKDLKKETKELQTDDNNEPPTTKTSFIAAFIKTIPYIAVSQVEFWLRKLYDEITRRCTPEERAYCEQILWNSIANELGLSRADIGIQWWYTRDIDCTSHL